MDNGLITSGSDNPRNTHMGAQIAVTAFSDNIYVEGNMLNGGYDNTGKLIPKELLQPNDTIDLENLMLVSLPTERHLNSTFSGNLPKTLRINADHIWHELNLNFSTVKEYKIKNYNSYYTVKGFSDALPGDIVTVEYTNMSSTTPYGITWPANGNIIWTVPGNNSQAPDQGETKIWKFEFMKENGAWIYKQME